MDRIARNQAIVGTVELDGSRREANLSLLTNPKVGEYVIVHAGFAIEKLDEQDANERIAMFDELAKAGGSNP